MCIDIHVATLQILYMEKNRFYQTYVLLWNSATLYSHCALQTVCRHIKKLNFGLANVGSIKQTPASR